jgi:hypothetical protein
MSVLELAGVDLDEMKAARGNVLHLYMVTVAQAISDRLGCHRLGSDSGMECSPLAAHRNRASPCYAMPIFRSVSPSDLLRPRYLTGVVDGTLCAIPELCTE